MKLSRNETTKELRPGFGELGTSPNPIYTYVLRTSFRGNCVFLRIWGWTEIFPPLFCVPSSSCHRVSSAYRNPLLDGKSTFENFSIGHANPLSTMSDFDLDGELRHLERQTKQALIKRPFKQPKNQHSASEQSES